LTVYGRIPIFFRMGRIGIRTRRWRRAEYDRAIEAGIFHEDERLELIAGRLIVAEPQNSPHATGIQLAADALRAAFGSGWQVRVQLPLALGDWSEPEPDLAVVPGSARDYRDAHPSHAALVVEIADSSVRLDRRLKASIYAQAGIAEYWIVNLVDRALEMHRDPCLPDPRRWTYRSVHVARPAETISPLAAPTARISISDLLP
jgi:Uma2 family endonuclease